MLLLLTPNHTPLMVKVGFGKEKLNLKKESFIIPYHLITKSVGYSRNEYFVGW